MDAFLRLGTVAANANIVTCRRTSRTDGSPACRGADSGVRCGHTVSFRGNATLLCLAHSFPLSRSTKRPTIARSTMDVLPYFGSTSEFFRHAPNIVRKAPMVIRKENTDREKLMAANRRAIEIERQILEVLGKHPRIVPLVAPVSSSDQITKWVLSLVSQISRARCRWHLPSRGKTWQSTDLY